MGISGKFKKWLDANGQDRSSKQIKPREEMIESFNGMSLRDLKEYIEVLIAKHGEDCSYAEDWYGYEEFRPIVVKHTEETDWEYEVRIERLKSQYDKMINEEQKRNEIEKLEAERIKLETKINALKRGW